MTSETSADRGMSLERRYRLFLAGIFVNLTAVHGIFSIVSSLNVQEGLGTTSFAVSYATSIVFTACVPVLIEFVSIKKVLLCGQSAYCLFMAGNAYTSYFTLIPGGIFLGIGEGVFWSCAFIMRGFFARKWAKSKNKDFDKTLSYFSGHLFTALQCGVLCGNGVSSLFLFVDRTLSKRAGNFTRSTDFTFCGVNDCQADNVTLANIEQYTPYYPATRYCLIAFLCLLVTIAISILYLAIPADAAVGDDEEDVNIDENLPLEEEILIEASHDEEAKSDHISACSKITDTFKKMAKFTVKRKHLLVMLFPIYDGMLIGFVLAEITRSFASCVLGVDQVGIGVLLYGTTDALFSYVGGKVAGKYNRNIPYAWAFIVDITAYVFCLNWEITQDNSWVVYILFLAFGVSDGVWQALTNDMYGHYFKGEEKIAYSMWNLLAIAGMCLQFSISKLFCMYQKIYIQITVLCAASLTYAISYYIYYIRENTTSPTSGGERHLVSEEKSTNERESDAESTGKATTSA
ncbi:unnamed protein product [Clavelina lepadiformis]|uniref:Protein unc-93 homolog A n=1 Tax=Clavelina lepadiformis TaxID=159417 RepID=A0ABP0FNT3_CLALP